MSAPMPTVDGVPAGATRIYRRHEGSSEELLGFIDGAGSVQQLRWGRARLVGRADADDHLYRITAHGERELGHVLPTGSIHSAGLLEGGALGWLEPDGVVIQGGLILGEEEVGRVEGARAPAAAAALLLIFLPDEAEATRRAAR